MDGFQISKIVYLMLILINFHITFFIYLHSTIALWSPIWRWHDYYTVSYYFTWVFMFVCMDRLSNSHLSLSIWHSIFLVIGNTIILLILYYFIIAFWIILLSLPIWTYNCYFEFTTALFHFWYKIYFGINNFEYTSSTFGYLFFLFKSMFNIFL